MDEFKRHQIANRAVFFRGCLCIINSGLLGLLIRFLCTLVRVDNVLTPDQLTKKARDPAKRQLQGHLSESSYRSLLSVSRIDVSLSLEIQLYLRKQVPAMNVEKIRSSLPQLTSNVRMPIYKIFHWLTVCCDMVTAPRFQRGQEVPLAG